MLARQDATRCASMMILPYFRVCASRGASLRNGMTGCAPARAVTSSAPTSRTGRPRISGRPTFNSLKRRRRSAFTRAIFRSDRSGITRPEGSKRTFWSAFSPTCSGRHSNNGWSAPDSVTALVPSLKNSVAFTAPTSFCQPPNQTPASSESAASYAQIPIKLHCSIGSAFGSQNGCASPRPSIKCSADFSRKLLNLRETTPQTAEVGLTDNAEGAAPKRQPDPAAGAEAEVVGGGAGDADADRPGDEVDD